MNYYKSIARVKPLRAPAKGVDPSPIIPEGREVKEALMLSIRMDEEGFRKGGGEKGEH